ncbi:anhydro-N-acetylmuramic acid kinase [Rhodohalobacter sp.]|uniref:anhydro-N-acetylmuramic acid kinase n=1 Tax=Rhodohalobacter sp. TaxID=1974210 RepID=UPI002ACEE4AE|nr:anhydro-N-acetylmuramic acid kinase [Rhodohalobacter sp.]MDZ7756359.1 anhydro-N-acetylmuramic acid kinase [Rhodohalobacter sp.]
MNKYITKLSEISSKPERLIVGLMSGTSLDGLDIALCKCKSGFVDVKEFRSVEYSKELIKRLSEIQSRVATNTKELTLLHTELANYYGEAVIKALIEWGVPMEEVDLIASHGQTIYHAPAQTEKEINATLQIVDGDHIAQKTGIITISDFRQKHTSVGGEGAPLAGIFDEAVFRDETKHRLLINLGGIANLTWLPSKNSGNKVMSGDTGPANTLINEAMIKYFDRTFDERGKVAASGKVHSELVRYILLEPYFRKPFPKTTGQEDFRLNYIEELMEGHGIECSEKDLIASLTSLTAQSISRAVDQITNDEAFECYVSGGGVHNESMMKELEERIPQGEFKDFEELGIPADAKEAAMMSFFANDLVSGDGFSIPGVTEEKVHFGKISLPD